MENEGEVKGLAAVEPIAQGPKVRGEIRLVLFEDGNYQVWGPLDDRILWNSLIGLAQEAGIMHVLGAEERHRRDAIARQSANPKNPGVVRRFLDARKGRKEAEEVKRMEGERQRVAKQAREEQERLKLKREQEEGRGAQEAPQQQT